jgi:protoheme IX farnesyltransferase
MSDALLLRQAPIARLRDLVELGKPRLSVLVIFTAAVGVWLAPDPIDLPGTVFFLLATSGLVAAANTLNCWIEKEIDGLMHRTRKRPLPSHRLEPRTALISGLTLSAAALTSLSLTTNVLTTLLGAIALVSYVLVYTPLKRLSPWALLVGAIPGALPPLMGWTAATGSLGIPGWYLFGVLFLWQLPHFLAISIYLRDDFRRGGLRVLPLVRGNDTARRYLIGLTTALVLHSLAAQPLGLAGAAYTSVAALLGGGFLFVAATGAQRRGPEAWARRVFAYTLIYLPLLVAVLVLDR